MRIGYEGQAVPKPEIHSISWEEAAMERITSRQNPLMAHIRKLASSRAYRNEAGEYLGDGVKLLDVKK